MVHLLTLYLVLESSVTIFLYILTSVLCFSLMNAILTEKENNLFKYMRCFGLKVPLHTRNWTLTHIFQDSAYFVSWMIWFMANHMVLVLIMLMLGYAIPGLLFFTNCNFFVHLLNFTAYGVGLAGFVMFYSVFLRSALAGSIFQ